MNNTFQDIRRLERELRIALAAQAESLAIARSLLAALDRTPGHMPFEDVIAVSNARDRLRELDR